MDKEYRLDDLKIIDELLCMMRGFDESWEHIEHKYNITNLAVSRLRDAYFSGEMKSTTASLAIYFDSELKISSKTIYNYYERL